VTEEADPGEAGTRRPLSAGLVVPYQGGSRSKRQGRRPPSRPPTIFGATGDERQRELVESRRWDVHQQPGEKVLGIEAL
jgi:hypothetical protein